MGLMFHALEAHRRAQGTYPATGHDVSALRAALVPTHAGDVPTRDAWGRPLLFDMRAETWTIASETDRPGPLLKHGPMGLTPWSWRECGCPGDLLRPPPPRGAPGMRWLRGP
jgi:hypothetical protein